jgi:hypothetical protein
MPASKEPMFFCTDLDTGTEDDRRIFITKPGDYLSLFSAASPDQLMGEACVFNLLSANAAARIRAVRPDARIVISLREPVDQMISFHASRVMDGVEDLPFREAIAAEPLRERGERLPEHARIVPAYRYREVASYSAQVERYLDAFGRDNVLVLSFDDLASRSKAAVDRVLEFLGAEAAGPPIPDVINAQRQVRWPRLARALRSRVAIRAAKRIVPRPLHPLASGAVDRLARMNLRDAPAPPVDEDFRMRLREELSTDVRRLSSLVEMDFSERWHM